MKSKFTLLLFCLQTFFVFSQSVGIGTANIDPSAKLQVESSSQGLLPPRLSTSQRNAIINPAAGLMIFNTTTACIEYYDGSIWESTCNTGANTILYDKIFTAKWLDTSSVVINTFGQTHTYNATEDYVLYNDGSPDNTNLFSIDLIPSNILSDNKSYIVEITLSESQISTAVSGLATDNDLLFGIANMTDNDFVGFGINDNPTAQLTIYQGTKGTIFSYDLYQEFKGASSTGHAKLVKACILLDKTSKTWGAFSNIEYEDWEPAALTYTRIIEPSKGLQLQLYRNGTFERYIIDYIHVQIRKVVE